MPYTHILAPTDFSEAAKHALHYAFEEATNHQARLTLLHVLQHHTGPDVYYIKGAPVNRLGFEADVGGPLPSSRMAPPETIRRDYEEEALTQLRDIVPDSFHGTWEVEVAAGDPSDTIVRIAQEYEADLIVMGTHGRTGLQHVLLGSVAEKVVRHASCPVLTIRHSPQAS